MVFILFFISQFTVLNNHLCALDTTLRILISWYKLHVMKINYFFCASVLVLHHSILEFGVYELFLSWLFTLTIYQERYSSDTPNPWIENNWKVYSFTLPGKIIQLIFQQWNLFLLSLKDQRIFNKPLKIICHLLF